MDQTLIQNRQLNLLFDQMLQERLNNDNNDVNLVNEHNNKYFEEKDNSVMDDFTDWNGI